MEVIITSYRRKMEIDESVTLFDGQINKWGHLIKYTMPPIMLGKGYTYRVLLKIRKDSLPEGVCPNGNSFLIQVYDSNNYFWIGDRHFTYTKIPSESFGDKIISISFKLVLLNCCKTFTGSYNTAPTHAAFTIIDSIDNGVVCYSPPFGILSRRCPEAVMTLSAHISSIACEMGLSKRPRETLGESFVPKQPKFDTDLLEPIPNFDDDIQLFDLEQPYDEKDEKKLFEIDALWKYDDKHGTYSLDDIV